MFTVRGFLLFFVVLISLPLIWIGVSAIKNTIIEQNTTKKVRASVKGNLCQTGAGGTVCQAEVEFIHLSGQTIRFTDSVGAYPADYQPGDSVWVYYNPTKPHEAYIYTFKRKFLVPCLFLFIGLLPLILAVWIIRKFSL